MSKKYILSALCRMILGASAFYLLIGFALWHIYSMPTMISGGSYTSTQAKSLTLRMALVTTILSFVGVLCGRLLVKLVKKASAGKATLISSLMIGFVLTLYTVLNLMFPSLSPWSELNAHFFDEYNWLNYPLFLIPATMIFSACISFWFWRNFAGSEQKL